MVALALLVGLAGAAVLTATAGARRTASTLSRVVADEQAPDVVVNPDSSDGTPTFAAEWAAVDRLPEVRAVATLDGVAVAPVDSSGRPELSGFVAETNLAFERDTWGDDAIDRPHLLAGTYPDPGRSTDILINETKARRDHLHVGSQVRLAVFALDDAGNPGPGGLPRPRFVDTFTVVGIGLSLDDAARASDDPNLTPTALYTPALLRRLGPSTPPFVGKEVLLKHGERDVDSFEAAVRKVMSSRTANFDGSINFQEGSLTVARAQRALRPYIFALWMFAGLSTVAALGVIGQAMVRSTRALRLDRSQLVAVGFTQRQIVQVAVLRGAFVGATGAAVALAITYLASSLMPIGPLRRIDPVRGRQFDATVLGWGTIALIAVLATMAALAMRRRRTSAVGTGVPIADRLAALGLPARVVTGVRFAVDRGRDVSVPVRSTVFGLVVALLALVATLVYGASMAHFTSTPRQYGWPWSYLVEFDPADRGHVDTVIAQTPAITAAAPGYYSQFDIGRRSVSVIGIDASNEVPFLPVLQGRAPHGDDEVVLGETTLRTLHAHVGQTITATVQQQSHTFTIVGTAVFPRMAPYSGSEPTGLGVGAATTAKAMVDLKAQLGSPFDVVMVRPHASLDVTSFRKALNSGLAADDLVDVWGAQRPNDVLSYDNLSSTPLALAMLLIVLALGSAIHLLGTSVRSRRRDVAIFKTFGFTRRDVRTAVLIQAAVLVGTSLVIAVPLGWITGRALWRTTAHWLGIPTDPVFPGAAVLLVVLCALAAAGAIAIGPAILAARTPPSVALHAE